MHVDFLPRLETISGLAENLDIRVGVTVTGVERGHGYVVAALHEGRQQVFTARSLVVATGRLWNHGLQYEIPTAFRRYEIGVRVEQPAEQFVFKDHPDLDPKWVYRLPSPSREYRTFCCCRNGTLVRASTRAGVLLSGQADGVPTSRSNFGLMVRYLEPTDEPWQAGLPAFAVEASELLTDADALAPYLGRAASLDLANALRLVNTDVGSGLETATLHGPCLEGVGLYLSPDTQGEHGGVAPGEDVSVVRRPRGLVPAGLSCSC